MVIKAVVADLDGTLVDSDALLVDREARRWKVCVGRCGEIVLYEGMEDALSQLRARSIRLGIVTSSVSYYAQAVLRARCIVHDVLVAYHDTARHKPAPEPFLSALVKLDVSPSEVIGLGDSVDDLRSLRSAGIYAVAAGWNAACHDRDEWDAVALTPRDFACIVLAR